MRQLYITTAIDYVNNLPHLGTAYEKIGADAIARFRRMEGDKVHFQMGNDEHSAGVKKAAEKEGLPSKKYCDGMKEKFTSIWASLGISYDDFIQTSEKRHYTAVTTFIGKMKKEDLYKKRYEGWYCEPCEAFTLEKDLVDGNCATHKSKPRWLSEENYFFKLSAYQDKLLQHYKEHPRFILPEIRRNEVRNFVKAGLQDISISRAGLDWGIPFPGDSSHTVYVWFDALINYLTATGYGSKTVNKKIGRLSLWPAELHLVGKDITRFHCVIWPAMLMSAGLALPKTVFGHGFVFLKGEKMSKTLGNIVTPLDIIPRYGADALRYYLLRESSFGADGDFTWDNFTKRYNGDLANDIGNLLNRTLGMANKYLEGHLVPLKKTKPLPEDTVLKDKITGVLKIVREEVDWQKSGDINFHKALAAIWEVIGATDKYIDSSAPWRLVKEEKTEELKKTLYNVADSLRNIALLIAPFLPKTSREIWSQLGLEKKLKWEKQVFKNIGWGKTPATQVTAGKPIFPRIDISPSLPSVPTNKENKMENQIEFSEFQKLELRIAEVKQAAKVEKADKLLVLQIDIGGDERQIVAGIAQHYTPEELIGKKVVVVTNLKPAVIRGIESNGMLLAATDTATGKVIVLTPEKEAVAGSKVK
ncbi:MAG: methionine--tRNA ligase [Deltaproteobacteria bacterium]|nr:methionine--tRNA ligase [Deltaproteobacteria bacterium]